MEARGLFTWRFDSSMILCCVVGFSMFRRISVLSSSGLSNSRSGHGLCLWKCRHHDSLKCQECFAKWQNITSQNAWISGTLIWKPQIFGWFVCSLELTTGPYPEHVNSVRILLSTPLLIIFLIHANVFRVVFQCRFFDENFASISHVPHLFYMPYICPTCHCYIILFVFFTLVTFSEQQKL